MLTGGTDERSGDRLACGPVLQGEDARVERCWEGRRHVDRPCQRGRGRAASHAGEGGRVADRRASRVSERRARVGLKGRRRWLSTVGRANKRAKLSVRGSTGLTGAGESELASSAGRGPRAREGARPAEREGRRARAGLSANGPSADRAEEKGGERGNWAGVGLSSGGLPSGFLGFGFGFLFLLSISYFNQTKPI